jgi:predicted nucleic acid-binding protein
VALIEYLLDTSVLTRLDAPPVRQSVGGLIGAGTAAICAITAAELLRGTRSPEHHAASVRRLGAFHRVPTPDDVWDRVVAVQATLAERGLHRSVTIPDLLIGAVAERNRLPVLHDDQDFDAIAEITGQRCEWVVPRGSVS